MSNYNQKYIKYKNKYFDLKFNMKGGGYFENIQECSNLGKNYYNKYTNQCCEDNKCNNCVQQQNTIVINKIIDLYVPEKFQLDGIYIKMDKTYLLKTTESNLKEEMLIYKYFKRNNEVFEKNKVIGFGKFGVTVMYKSNFFNEIAVKYGNIKDDKKIITELINKRKLCDELIIPYVLKDDCIIMERAKGTLTNLKINNFEVLIDVLYSIVVSINCLFNINIYYSDIKMNNIFYRDTEKGIEVILGDLGSAFLETDKNLLITWTYFDKFDDIELIITWGIGILILEIIFGIKYVLKLYTDITNKKVNNEQKIIILVNSIKENINITNAYKYTKINNIIYNLICSEENRWNLQRLLDEIILLRNI